LYGKVSGGTAKFRLQVYVRTGGGTETLVRDEFSNDFTDTVPTLQEWLVTPASGGALSTSDRIVARISARRVGGPTNVTVTLYGEGSAHASQIQTTIPLSASAPVSASPPLSVSGGNISIDLSAYAPLASPVFTGNPTAPTPTAGDSDTSIATTAFVTAFAAPLDALACNGLQINGSMDVMQERGYGAIATNGLYICDGWQYVTSNSGFTTNAAVVSVPTFIYGLPNVCSISVVTGKPSLAAGDYASIAGAIEGYRVARLAWGRVGAPPITIGFWSAHTPAGLYSGTVRNSTTGSFRSYAFTYTQAVSTTPQFNIITIPADTTGTWAANNTAGMVITFALAAEASTLTAPSANTWVAGNYIAAPGQVNGVSSAGNALRITGVCILPGTQAPTAAQSPLIMRPYDQELVTCQRYYQKTYASDVVPGTASSGGWLSGTANGNINRPYVNHRFMPVMRISPTITFYSFTTGTIGKCRNTSASTDLDATTASLTMAGAVMHPSATPTTDHVIGFHLVADARL